MARGHRGGYQGSMWNVRLIQAGPFGHGRNDRERSWAEPLNRQGKAGALETHEHSHDQWSYADTEGPKVPASRRENAYGDIWSIRTEQSGGRIDDLGHI